MGPFVRSVRNAWRVDRSRRRRELIRFPWLLPRFFVHSGYSSSAHVVVVAVVLVIAWAVSPGLKFRDGTHPEPFCRERNVQNDHIAVS